VVESGKIWADLIATGQEGGGEARLREEQREMARVIQGSAESLLTIINDILDFSRIEAGQLRIELWQR
jgi:signal transduction histidine kinase